MTSVDIIRNNEHVLHKEALAKNLDKLNPEAFWHEIMTISNCNTPLPTCIEGVADGSSKLC